jgi:hypothetical protein
VARGRKFGLTGLEIVEYSLLLVEASKRSATPKLIEKAPKRVQSQANAGKQ